MNSKYAGVLAVIAASVLWGTTGTASSLAPEVSGMAVGAAAMGLGGLLQALFSIHLLCRQRQKLWQQWRLILAGGLAVAVYPLAFYTSMRMAGVTIGTIISLGSAPVFSALIEYFADGSGLRRRWFYGAVLGITGMLLLSLSSAFTAFSVRSSSAIITGSALGLAAGVTYAFYSWSAHQLINTGLHTRAAMGATFGCGGILLLPVLFLTGGTILQSWDSLLVNLYLILVPMFLGYLCFGYGLAWVRASIATAITLLEPVVAALLAVLVIGESLETWGWVGCVLVLGSQFVITGSTEEPVAVAQFQNCRR